MPIYSIQGPDGKIYEIEGPAGATKAQVVAAIQAKMQAPEPAPAPALPPIEPPKREGFGAAFGKGLEGLISPSRTAIGAVTGSAEEAALAGLKRAEASPYADQVSLEKVKEAYQRGLLPAAGEVIRQIPLAITEQLPNIAATLGSARLGAMAGAPLGPYGAIGGGILGAVAPSLLQQFGGNIQRQAQEQLEAKQPVDISRTAAIAAAVPQAGLDVAATLIPLGRTVAGSVLGPQVKQLLEKGAKESAERLARESLPTVLAKGAGISIATEAPTEAIQSMLERAQAGLPLLSEDAFKEYGEAAYQAALIAPIGAAARVGERSAARQRPLMEGMRPGETERQAAERLQAEILAMKQAAQPPAPPPPGPILSTNNLYTLMAQPNGYGLVENYKQRLMALPEQTPEIKQAIEDATFAQRRSVIEAAERRAPRAPVEKPKGGKDVGKAVPEPSGAGVPLAGEPGARPAAEGAGAPVPSGVVPAVEDAGQPAGGEAKPAAPVTPKVEALQGSETRLILPDGEKRSANWEVIEADSVSAAMSEGRAQPRDRQRAASNAQVLAIAQNPDFDRLSDTSQTMDYGAPTLTSDYVIVGGNGRFEGVNLSYDTEVGQAYKQNLISNAQRFGLDPAQVSGMKKPVLIRKMSGESVKPDETRKLAIQSNIVPGLEMSDMERAALDSERMTNLQELDITDTGDIPLTTKNMGTIRDALKGYTKEELSGMLAADGSLSQSGLRRVKNAVLYKAYGKTDTLARLLESPDADLKNVGTALMRASGNMSRLMDGIRSNAIPADYDIIADLTGAVETLSALRASGTKVQDFINQSDMFGDGISNEAKTILTFLDQNLRSAKSITEFLNDYANAAISAESAGEGLFGEVQLPSKQETIERAAQRPEAERAAAKAQQTIFEQPAGAPATEGGAKPEGAGRAPEGGEGAAIEGVTKKLSLRLNEVIQEAKSSIEAQIKDWSSRVYKANKKQVELAGDGPSRQASMSVSQINESKRRRAVEGLQAELKAVRDLEKQIADPEMAERLLNKAKRLFKEAQERVASGEAQRKDAGLEFEATLLSELGIRPPRGAYESNNISKAIRRVVETLPAEQEVAEQEAKPYEPLTEQQEEDVLGLFAVARGEPKKSLVEMRKRYEAGRAAPPAPEAPAEIPPERQKLNEEIQKKLDQLEKILTRIMGRFGLKDVALKIVEDLRDANAEYSENLIRLALDAANPVRNLRHESIHALKELGFFTPQQWNVLQKQAQDKWIDQYLRNVNVNQEPLSEGEQSRFDAYMALFQKQGMSEAQINEAIIEEAIADAFGEFDVKKPVGLMQSILQRMRNLFTGLKNGFNGLGYQTAEDVFAGIEKGTLKPEKAVERKAEPKASLRVIDMTERRARQLVEEENAEVRQMLDERANWQRGRDLETLKDKIYPWLKEHMYAVDKARRVYSEAGVIPGIQAREISGSISSALDKFEYIAKNAYTGVYGEVRFYGPPNEANAFTGTRYAENTLDDSGKEIVETVDDYLKAVEEYRAQLNNRSSRQREMKKALAEILDNVVVGKFAKPSLRDAAKIDLDRSLNDKRISPRLPTAVKAKEDAMGEVRLQPDLDTFKRDDTAFRHNIALMSKYPNFSHIKGTPAQRAEQMIEHMKGNLLWLFNSWDAKLRDRSKLWYVGGNRISHRWAEKYGIPAEQAAGIIAALSPQKDWFQNVSLAERTLDALVFNADTTWSPEMTRVFKERAWAKKFPLKKYQGTTLKDMYRPGDAKSLVDMAVWIRAWDEANNVQTARVITPEGTFTNEMAAGKTGKPVAMRAQSFAAMVKTLQVLQQADLQVISDLIGKNHKVRSFYNNIIAPYAGDDVTIDTHAVAAALLRPLGSSDLEVYHNFGSAKPAKKDKEGNILVPASAGTKNSAVTGLYGTYAMYAEAYRRAAQEAGVLPREMQSITWEAIRGLFRPEQKQAKLKNQTNVLWNKVGKGEIDGQTARDEISKLVSGIEDPAWAKSPVGANESRTDSSYADELPGVGVPGREPAGVPSGTGERVAGAVPERGVKLSLRTTIPLDIRQRIGQTTVAREEKGFVQRITEAISPKSFSTFRAAALHRYNQLGVNDQKLAEQMGGKVLLANVAAEPAALLSDLGAGLTASALGVHDRVGGVPVYKNGITTISNLNGTVKGAVEIFVPLAKLNDPYAYQAYGFWAGVKRGSRFMADGREQLFEPADIKRAEDLRKQFLKMGVDFEAIQKEWIKYNNGLVDYMVDTGVLSKDRADIYKKHSDYLPFYRQMDGVETVGPKIFQAISGVKPPKKLKGSEAPIDDFLENIVRNTQAAIQAGVKNVAAQRAADVAVKIGIADRLPYQSSAPNTFQVLEKGKVVTYDCQDMLTVNAIKSLGLPDLPFIGMLSGPANLLRNLVTKDPGFMLANLMRDSMSAWVTSGVKMKPMVDTISNFGSALVGKDPAFQALMNAGILGGYEFSQNVEQSGREFGKALRKQAGVRAPGYKGILEMGAKPFTSLWEALEKGTTASDAATRMEVYKKTLAETGNEAEALYRALEVMNFNRKGSSAVIRVLTAAVPFLNARMQGLDVLYRASFGKMNAADAKEVQRRFFVRGATIMALSAAYWLLTHDDDEYKKQEQETRDNYWLLPSLGVKIPIPFEIGVLFKVIPERFLAYTFGSDTGEDFIKSMARQLTSTLAFNPIPQTALPVVEAMTNFSFFTMRPIVGQGLEGVQPAYQVGPGTSRLAEKIGAATKGLATELQISPMKLDQLINGYTGTMGMYLVNLMDAVYDMNTDSPKPSMRFERMPLIRRFALDPEARGSVTAYYELKNSVDSIVRTSNMLERTMNYEELPGYLQDNMQMLAAKDYLLDLEKTMKELREMKIMIRSSTMEADAKRDAILSIDQMENQLTANIQYLKSLAKGG